MLLNLYPIPAPINPQAKESKITILNAPVAKLKNPIIDNKDTDMQRAMIPIVCLLFGAKYWLK